MVTFVVLALLIECSYLQAGVMTACQIFIVDDNLTQSKMVKMVPSGQHCTSMAKTWAQGNHWGIPKPAPVWEKKIQKRLFVFMNTFFAKIQQVSFSVGCLVKAHKHIALALLHLWLCICGAFC